MVARRTAVLFTGVVLFAFGLLGLLINADFPRGQFSAGTVGGESWLGFEVNGWTNFFALVGAGVLLLGGAYEASARIAAGIVGAAAAVCCVMAVGDGDDVLGLAAANAATKAGFGVVAAVLLVLALVPSRRRAAAPVPPPAPEPAAAAPRESVVVEQSTPLTRLPARPTTPRRRSGLGARLRHLTRR
jgi:hypothetical protein